MFGLQLLKNDIVLVRTAPPFRVPPPKRNTGRVVGMTWRAGQMFRSGKVYYAYVQYGRTNFRESPAPKKCVSQFKPVIKSYQPSESFGTPCVFSN